MSERPDPVSQVPPAVRESATTADAPTLPNVAPSLRELPAPARVDRLPPFRVLLHNDELNDMVYVVETLVDLTPLDVKPATRVMIEAHKQGVALVLVTHRERAELYVDQFRSRGLKITIEQAE